MDITDALALVEASPDHRVLRRIKLAAGPIVGAGPAPAQGLNRGLFVDTETTGLDHDKDAVIELAAVPFSYDDTGAIYEVGVPFHSYQDPGRPIPPEMTKIHGITDEMVAGKVIGVIPLAAIAGSADLVIAHNAAFDRPFCVPIWQGFAQKAWACSMEQIPWDQEGVEGRKLSYIASSLGYFYEAHRAVDDCMAAIFLLSLKLPSGRTGLAHLLDRALQDSRRVWAIDSDIALKDELKARGYRWNDGKDGRYRAWHKEVWADGLDAEAKYLRDEIYRGQSLARSTAVTPYTRFTGRG